MVNPFKTVWELFQYLLGIQKRQLFLAAPPSELNNAPPPPTFMSRLWSYLPFVAKPAPPSKRNTRLDKLPRNDIRRLVQVREPEPACRCYTRADGIRVVFTQCRHVDPIHPAPVPVLEIPAEPVVAAAPPVLDSPVRSYKHRNGHNKL